MVTTVTVSCDPEQSWQRKALSEVEASLGHALDIWTHTANGKWCGPEVLDNAVPGEPCSEVTALIEIARREERAVVREQTPGEFLFAMPLGKHSAASSVVITDSPELLIGLADVGSRFFRQQEVLHRLQEENEFFLKQVSEDFEELTFLRSMAQRLGLGDDTHTLEQLVSATLPELGKSSHAEELYFVLESGGKLSILADWHVHELLDLCDSQTVEKLVQQYREAAREQALIRNQFGETPPGQDFPGVRDFVIVPVGNDEPALGWFVAVNRVSELSEEASEIPEWRLNQHEFGTSEASLLSTAAAMIASHHDNVELFQEREQLLVNVVRTLVSAIEAKDQYTCGHSERVALYGKRLAEQMGYSHEACELLYLTGLLHDIGKIAINDAILNKPDRLTDSEFAEIQRHPEEGWNILQELQQLSYVLPGVLHHHERVDGKGYPDQLAGNKIPLDGRILAVADAYDAMTSDRAYRTGMPHDKAINIIREGAGSQWDSGAVEAFLQIEDEITEIRTNYTPREKPHRQPATADKANA